MGVLNLSELSVLCNFHPLNVSVLSDIHISERLGGREGVMGLITL